MIKKKSRTDQSEEARLERVAALRSKTGKKLPAFSLSYLNSENLVGNIENFIGSTSLPLGLAGPLKIHFNHSTNDIQAAFATTEGALVSSISRGVLALNLSSGVTVRCIENTVTRAPVFMFSSLNPAIEFAKWLPSQIDELKRKTKEHSKHAVLLDLQIKIIINEVHVLFIYSTGEAAGQNMTTLITSSLVQTVRQRYLNATNFWIENFRIEGNLASDKKVSASLFSVGRGRKIIAEAVISAAVCKKVLKVSNQELCKNFNRMKSARVFAGYQGFNINVANVVAGLFLATGQDAACIHESSAAELHMEMKGEDLFVSLFMPSLIVGTIGGGTHLPHAKNCLDLRECEGLNSADKLAQIICSYALALELSTVSAIESGHFVQAHSSLGRDSQKSIKPDEIDSAFLNEIRLDQNSEFQFAGPIEAVDFDDAMMVDLASVSARRISGLFRLKAQFKGSTSSQNLILKIKNSDTDIISTSKFMLQNLGLGSICENEGFYQYHPFANNQLNEIEKNKILSTQNWDFVPKIHIASLKNSVGFVLQSEVIGATKQFQNWNRDQLEQALDHLSVVHNSSLPIPTETIDYQKSQSLWLDLSNELIKQNIIKTTETKKIFNFCTDRYEEAFSEFGKLEKRFCHLDFNPRNLLFSENKIYIVDWEFSGFHLPQRDFIEFMIFNMQSLSDSDLMSYSKSYAQKIKMSQKDWQLGFLPAFCDFVLRRLSLYLVIAEFKEVHFLNHVLINCSHFLKIYLDPQNESR